VQQAEGTYRGVQSSAQYASRFCGNLAISRHFNPTRAQTAYIQGNGPKMMRGMLRGTMGGLELSELTVFWKIIDSFSGELLSD